MVSVTSDGKRRAATQTVTTNGHGIKTTQSQHKGRKTGREASSLKWLVYILVPTPNLFASSETSGSPTGRSPGQSGASKALMPA